MKKLLIYFLFGLTFQFCSSGSSTINNFNYPLTESIAASKTSSISLRVPYGWFIAEDNECKCIDIWLIKDDYTATLNLNSINLDSQTEKEIKNNELEQVRIYSKAFLRAKLGKTFSGFSNEEIFEIGNRKFSAYQYLDNENRNIRVVVFKFKEKFFELSAIPNGIQELNELYRIQNSVLNSLN